MPGLSHYGAEALQRIMGRRSDKIEAILGYEFGETVVRRDDLVVR